MKDLRKKAPRQFQIPADGCHRRNTDQRNRVQVSCDHVPGDDDNVEIEVTGEVGHDYEIPIDDGAVGRILIVDVELAGYGDVTADCGGWVSM